jgi:hypothetical protein
MNEDIFQGGMGDGYGVDLIGQRLHQFGDQFRALWDSRDRVRQG